MLDNRSVQELGKILELAMIQNAIRVRRSLTDTPLKTEGDL
jgi:hypothetical protein